jgi:hypothetical protein
MWEFSFKAAFAAAITAALITGATADPLTVSNVFEFLDNRSSNDAGVSPGEIVEFGATQVNPNGANGTTGYATLGSLTRPLTPQNYTLDSNFFSGGIRDDGTAATRGSWQLQFQNGADTKTVSAPSVPLGLTALPFATNVLFTTSGLQPTFTWTNTAAGIDAVSIKIRDNGVNSNEGGGFTSDLIYSDYTTPTTTFTAPVGVLSSNHTYSIEIDQVVLRNPAGPLAFANTENQSRSYFDFSTVSGGPTGVYLPTVELQADGVPAYSFSISVLGGETYFVDPKVATGYDFSVGEGDPDFKSVVLPLIAGTDSYTIVLPDGTKFTVVPNEVFDFTMLPAYVDGVASFEVLGINPDSKVNPYDSLAFAPGLTFVSDGSFTGTMIPITADVPETSTWAMMLLGFAGLGYAGYWRSRTAVAVV